MTVRLSHLILACSALLLPLCTLAGDWRVDPADSRLGFRAEAQGEAFDGRFTRFEARIRFDPGSLDDSRFEVDIALDSVDSRNSERDEMLAEPEFFNIRADASARYRAERFEALGDGRFRALGELTLRGVTRPVPLDFDWRAEAGSATLDGGAELDRLAFEVGGGDWADADVIAHAVRVTTRLVLRAVDAD
jgi:polyisoprenoid-binding protein YceI